MEAKQTEAAAGLRVSALDNLNKAHERLNMAIDNLESKLVLLVNRDQDVASDPIPSEPQTAIWLSAHKVHIQASRIEELTRDLEV